MLHPTEIFLLIFIFANIYYISNEKQEYELKIKEMDFIPTIKIHFPGRTIKFITYSFNTSSNAYIINTEIRDQPFELIKYTLEERKVKKWRFEIKWNDPQYIKETPPTIEFSLNDNKFYTKRLSPFSCGELTLNYLENTFTSNYQYLYKGENCLIIYAGKIIQFKKKPLKLKSNETKSIIFQIICILSIIGIALLIFKFLYMNS